MQLRELDADLTQLSERLRRAEAHGDYELAVVLSDELDRLLDMRPLLVADADDCTR